MHETLSARCICTELVCSVGPTLWGTAVGKEPLSSDGSKLCNASRWRGGEHQYQALQQCSLVDSSRTAAPESPVTHTPSVNCSAGASFPEL